jgi:hypothetical protein
MPIYNFTVSQFTFTEAVTDAVYAGNMISGGTMTITPNSGYVVSASSFSAAGTLPGQFASISFSDTAVAGEVDNTVLVTFTFSALFEMTSELENINLPISGHADLLDDKRRISINFDFIDNTTENLNGATALTQAAGITKDPSIGEPSADSNGLKTTNFSGTIDAENSIHVATVILERNPLNFHFNDNATISVENAPSSANFSLQHVSTAATNSEGQATHLQYHLKLNSDVSIPSGLDCKVFIHYTGIADISSTKEIRQIIYGPPEISIKGATKRIKIVGDVGAEFDLTVTKNSDNTSIMDTDLANADVIHIPKGLIRGLNKTLTSTNTSQLFATYEFIQEFPSASSNEIYHINVTPKGSTILNSNLEQAPPQGIIYQYINPTLTIRATTANGLLANQTNIVYTGRPNKKPGQLKNIKTVVEFFQIDYTITNSAGRAVSKVDDDPKWSSTVSTNSDWTNSLYSTNGGTHIEIVNIATTYGTPSATLKADVIVKKFGTADVTMVLDLDDIFAAS